MGVVSPTILTVSMHVATTHSFYASLSLVFFTYHHLFSCPLTIFIIIIYVRARLSYINNPLELAPTFTSKVTG